MSKEKESKVEKNISAVEHALSNSELFIEKNQKMIMYVVAGIVIIIAGYIGFKKFYLAPEEKEAQAQMFWAERYFEKDSLNLALNGDGTNSGFLDIIDQYGITKSANLANYYAGMCFLKKGQFEDAINYLKKFDSDDMIVSSMAKGAIGDAYMELGDNEKAIENYIKAAKNNNQFTAPIYLMRAGWTYENMENYEEALKVYERIQKEFFKSSESREIEKYIARAKGMLNQK